MKAKANKKTNKERYGEQAVNKSNNKKHGSLVNVSRNYTHRWTIANMARTAAVAGVFVAVPDDVVVAGFSAVAPSAAAAQPQLSVLQQQQQPFALSKGSSIC